MSGRDRGRGRGRRGGGGRGDQLSPNPPFRGGRGRGGGPPPDRPAQPAAVRQQPPAPHSAWATAPSSSRQPHSVAPSPSITPSLSQEVDRKLSLQSTSPTVQPGPPSVRPPPQPSQVVQAPPLPPPSSSKSLRPPARPDYGTIGWKTIVRANHFLVEVADKDIHHYDVTISPEVRSKNVCRQIIKNLIELYRESHLGQRQLAYDGGKSIFTAGPLPFSSRDFVITLNDNDNPQRGDREFKLTIKFAAKKDLYHLKQFLGSRQSDAPYETVQALDVVLRSGPSSNFVVVGRSFFSPQLGQRGYLGDGIDYWKGFYQSLRLTQMGLSLNVDTSARAFYEPVMVSEFVKKYLNVRDLTRPLSDENRIKVKKALKGIKVQLTYGEGVKRYKITGVSAQPISQLTFPSSDTGVRTSVVQYFRERYQINLRFAFLPALQAGSDSKPVSLPMELCKIVEGQRYTKTLNKKQVTALLRANGQRPRDREESISQRVRSNNYEGDQIVKDFGIKVRDAPTSIDARVLPPPRLKYQGTQEDPRMGCWNMIDKKMVNGGRVDLWTCLNFSSLRPNDVSKFCDVVVNMCNAKGMDFNPTPLIPISSAHPGDIERALFDIHALSNTRLSSTGQAGRLLDILIIILPCDVSGSYGKAYEPDFEIALIFCFVDKILHLTGRIKRVCETELGIVSQCCQPELAIKLKDQELQNLALKINVKAGGRNTVLLNAIQKKLPYVTDRPTIILGADVTHPQPGEDSSPSIAAVVASMDWPEVTKYRGLVSAQTHRDEIIHDLYKTVEDPQRGIIHSGMVRELLIAFRRSTGQKPHRIIFYRDGVSEGQFNQVLLHEMDAIRKACSSLEDNYLPPVTFLVVQKRHHTRLFPQKHGDRNSTDRSGNILPGTVVDTGICHPTEFDFYLCSHAGIQGTSRPTHYHVLYDENRFTADALQMLTNSLCYTYVKCTRSVSIVPPAYYAHLAALRARYYIEGDLTDGESTGGGGGPRATRDITAAVRPLPQIKDNVKDVMFYC